MRKLTRKAKSLCVLSIAMSACLFGGVGAALPISLNAETSKSYVELYSPLDEVTILTTNESKFSAKVEDCAKTESGKGLVMSYTPTTSDVAVTIPLIVEEAANFQGLAFWIDVPETSDTYSFTMYIAKSQANWQTMELGAELTLIGEDGNVSTQTSVWKRQRLNGFTGWVMLPKEAYANPEPQAGRMYDVVFMIENVPLEEASRTDAIDLTLGSFGYYTDKTGFMYEKAGDDVMAKQTEKELDGYIANIDALVAKNDKQKKLRNEMLVYFSNIRENFNTLSAKEKVELAKGLYDEYYARMESYLYGDIRETDYIMSFALMSDTHFTSSWVNTNFLNALGDAKTLYPDLAAAFVLGDISNEGVSPTTEKLTELDDYYNWLDKYNPTYTNSKGEQIPIINVLGNHDVRGPSTEPGGKYPSTAYAPAIEMYLQREKLAKEAGSIQFDTWINGYHFIFLNTDKYHSDDCYLSAETITWLDETLSENEDGRPMFVMVHQDVDRVHVMDGASMTFKEVIARHPTAIVSSGHTHAEFGNARIYQNGEGVFINQPAMVQAATQYYLVEVYEGGVIYRAREAAMKNWYIDSDVVVENDNRANNELFNAKTFDVSKLAASGVTSSIVKADTVSGAALKLSGNGRATIPTYATGSVENYAGYALYMTADEAVKVSFSGNSVKKNATYYSIVNGAYVEKKADANGKIVADGWVVIPKASFADGAHPTKDATLGLTVASGNVYLDKVSYYFDSEDFLSAVSTLSYVFYNDGVVVSSGTCNFGSALRAPTNPTKETTQAYTYQFQGWDLDGDGKADELPGFVKGNVSAKAVYKETLRTYSYTFYAADGQEILLSGSAGYGTTINAPAVNSLFGWDLDGDGAAESLPQKLTDTLVAVAVTGIPPYENGTVIFDPAAVAEIPFSTYSYNSEINLCSYNGLPVKNEAAPTKKVAQFYYKYTDGERTQNGSNYVQLNIPYTGDVSSFQGYAMWVDVPATDEAFIGGLKINSQRSAGTYANGWTLIDSEGNVTTQKMTWYGEGDFPQIGKGFTGWVIVDKSYYGGDIKPSATSNLYFQIKPTGRTTEYTMNIGQILFYSDKAAIIEELSTKKDGILNYSFNDGNGYVYKSGQVSENESIIVPQDPVSDNPNVFFAGWDINEDGNPDALPVGGRITENLNAVALFYDVDAFASFNKGELKGWAKGEDGIQIASETYAASPTGKALHVQLNKDGKQKGTNYALLSLPSGQPKGIALWMDSSKLSSLNFQIFKNWKAKQHINDGGDYVYFYGDNGSLTKDGNWRKMSTPANFKGWIIIPMTVFASDATIYTGDVLRLGYALDENGGNLNGDIYFGEALTFECSVESFINQIDKKVYGFKDYDGSFLSSGLTDGALPVPANPSRAGWRFIGWDINGDGVTDTLPKSVDRTFNATAVYSRAFTYKFVDEKGGVILEKTAENGTLILPPFRYLENDPYYTYVLDYGEYEVGMLLTQDFTFTVRVVEKTERSYSVVFYAEDGKTVISSTTQGYGETIVAPQAPAKDGYNFVGWNGYSDDATVVGDMKFVAVYEKIADDSTDSGDNSSEDSSSNNSSSGNVGGEDSSNSGSQGGVSSDEEKPGKKGCGSTTGSVLTMFVMLALAGAWYKIRFVKQDSEE